MILFLSFHPKQGNKAAKTQDCCVWKYEKNKMLRCKNNKNTHLNFQRSMMTRKQKAWSEVPKWERVESVRRILVSSHLNSIGDIPN